jgi:hypothetical protein
MAKYRITSALMIGDAQALIKAIFPAYDGEQTWCDPSEIIVVFSEPQTPVDLGPLVKVELLPSE